MAPRDLVRVSWFSGTPFFIIGGYWLLRSLKVRTRERGGAGERMRANEVTLIPTQTHKTKQDSVMVAINGVEYIPQAKVRKEGGSE